MSDSRRTRFLCQRAFKAFFAPNCLAFSVLLAGVALAGCKGDSRKDKEPAPEPQSLQPPTKSAPFDASVNTATNLGPTGSIEGSVQLTGKAPQMPLLQMGSDPGCGSQKVRAETILVGQKGGLGNVLVRLAPGSVPKNKLPAFAAAPESAPPITIDQKGCMYRPRVQGGLRGQKLEVTNSDATTHNIHARELAMTSRKEGETLINRAQPPGVPVTLELGDEEVHKLRCDLHAWMGGFVVVGDNPYFATTDAQGRFTIPKVPAGSYTLELWHEYYGLKKQDLTVLEGTPSVLDARFDAEADNPNLRKEQ